MHDLLIGLYMNRWNSAVRYKREQIPNWNTIRRSFHRSLGYASLPGLEARPKARERRARCGGYGECSWGEALWHIVELGVSFGFVTLLFALIYKVLPAVELAWRDV